MTHSYTRRSRRWVSTATVAFLSASLLGLAPAAVAQPDERQVPGSDFDATWGGEPFYTEQQIATNGENGFPNYRIPALTVTNDGDVLASYDGRPTGGDSPGPNSVLQRRSIDNGATWKEQTVIAAGKTQAPIHGFSDPSYIVDRTTGDIFNFHLFSMDQGFHGSQPGTGIDDRNVQHANVARSSDGGETWVSETITADITPDPAWRSRFAASGQGIQLKHGQYAGRLIQQFLIINQDQNNAFQAVSVYSDDHGETWQAGEPVGVGMDENKTVELSDGRVMLNSRDSGGSKYRKVAISEDGGQTYGEVYLDRQLPDPTNNASIVRAFPNAEAGSAAAKVLLFSNAASQSSRSEGTVRMSCDDGQTWPASKIFQPGGVAYSTLAPLPDGNIGLLYEPDGGNGGLRFAKFNLAWLGGLCAGIEVDAASGPAGQSADIEVRVTNQTGAALDRATLDLNLPAGWSSTRVENVSLEPGVATNLTVPVTVPADAYAGEYPLTAIITTAQGTAQTDFVFTVEADDGALITVVPVLATHQDDYVRGDVLDYHFRVTNLSDETLAIVPSSDDLEGFNRPAPPNCGYGSLAPGASYTCDTAFHSVTQDDLDAGSFSPETTWTIHRGSYNGDEIGSLERTGPTAELTTIPGLVNQSELSVYDVSSEQAGEEARYAIDGDASTTWHTDWALSDGPHWITLDLGGEYKIGGLRYLGRQSGQNGMLREFELSASLDGEDWGEPIAAGELQMSPSPQFIETEAALGRYLRIDFLSSWSDSGRHFASAAEFNVAAVPEQEQANVIVDIASVADVEVPLGTTVDDAVAALAATTSLTDSSNTSHDVSLTWTVEGFDGDEPGDYTAIATFALPDGVAQAEEPLALEVDAIVTVLAAEASIDDGTDVGDDPVPSEDEGDSAAAVVGDLAETGAHVTVLVLGAVILLVTGALLVTRRRTKLS